MRVNIYAEEMTDRVDLITKRVGGELFVGVRFWLELPVTVTGNEKQVRGRFMHHADDDDSAAVTFWGRAELRESLKKAMALLDAHYDGDTR